MFLDLGIVTKVNSHRLSVNSVALLEFGQLGTSQDPHGCHR